MPADATGASASLMPRGRSPHSSHISSILRIVRKFLPVLAVPSFESK